MVDRFGPRLVERLRSRVFFARIASILARNAGVLYVTAAVLQVGSVSSFFQAVGELVWFGLGVVLLRDLLWAKWAAFLHIPVAAASGTMSLAAGSALAVWSSMFGLPGVALLASSVQLGDGATPAAWILVGGYGMHAVLLAPALGLDLQRRRELRRRAAEPPAELDLYRSSPFQVLALDPGEATTRTILRRLDELRALLGADLDPAVHLSAFNPLELWASGGKRDTTAVEAAAAALQSPPERLRCELFWFHLEGEPPEVWSTLSRGDIRTAMAIWCRSVGEVPATVREGQALLNLAVAHHLEVLEVERRLPYRVRQLDGLERLWRESLEVWARAMTTGVCWEVFRQRAESLADPRVQTEFLDRLRQELPARLLVLNATLARRGAELGRARYAQLHLDLIRSGILPGEACREAERVFLVRSLEEVESGLAPLAGSRPKPLDEVDVKAIAASVRRAAKSADAFGGRQFLALETSPIWRQVRRRLQEEVDRAVKGFHRFDQEILNWQLALVNEWNRVMTAHNNNIRLIPIRLESGLYASVNTALELRKILAAFRQAGTRLPELDGLLARVNDVARRSQTILRPLLDLVEGTGDDHAEALREDLKWVRKAAEVATKEAQMTRDHYQRNVNGMVMNLGG